ncbi:MAG: hypothetical protein WD398_04880 [Cyclobacteriaceae bacterium]
MVYELREVRREEIFYRFFVLTFLVFWTLAEGFAQEKDTLQNNQVETFDFIFLNGKVIDRFTFMGRDFGRKIPSANMDVMYYFNTGWYINASVFKFLDQRVPYQYAFSLGYQTDLSSIIDVDLSYSQFLVPGGSEVTGIQNMGVFEGTFGLDWNYLYSTLQLQALLSEKPDLFLISKHSRYFEFDQKLFKVMTVSFEPSFSFAFGTSKFYYLGEFGENEYETTEAIDHFNLLSWEFDFPVNFEWKNWRLEFQTRYIIPGKLPDFDESVSGFVYGSQLIFTIPIKKEK